MRGEVGEVDAAAILGGHVTATGRGTDAGLVRDLGAERFISTGAGRPGPAPGGFDVGIDTLGGAVLDGSHGLLRQGGRPVILGAPPDQELAGRYKVHAMSSSSSRTPASQPGWRRWPAREGCER